LTTTQLALNHSNLQLQALSPLYHKAQSETAELHLELAKARQDYTLLESKLRSIAQFEGEDSNFEIESIRGQLLQAANNEVLTILLCSSSFQQGNLFTYLSMCCV
jgi:hypothetical protein